MLSRMGQQEQEVGVRESALLVPNSGRFEGWEFVEKAVRRANGPTLISTRHFSDVALLRAFGGHNPTYFHSGPVQTRSASLR